MKGLILLCATLVVLTFPFLSKGKSMRVFLNNLVVDTMDYLELDLLTNIQGAKHG